jgi:hypothetical protein
MSTEMVDWVCAYLERDEDIVVPVKKMWNEWRVTDPEVSLEAFASAVLADARVEALGEVDHTEGMQWMSPNELSQYVEDMEADGYFSGPRVRLKAREITKEHVARMLKKHNDRMEAALRQAREVMPEDLDEKEEGMLIEVLQMVKQFREHLREAGLELEEGDDPEKKEPGP